MSMATVCAACRTVACWEGVLACEDARTAGTVVVPERSAARVVARSHPCPVCGVTPGRLCRFLAADLLPRQWDLVGLSSTVLIHPERA